MIMDYTPIHERVVPMLVFYIILSVFSTFMTVRMFFKWKERKVRPTLLMAIVFAIFTAALLVLTGGLIETFATGYFMEFYRFSLPFAYSAIVVADIVLFAFSREITDKESKILIPLSIVGSIIIVVLFLPWNWWGVPTEDYAGKLNIRTPSTLAMVLYSWFIYINIGIICYRAKAQADNKVARAGFTFLFYAMICLILFFLMFMFDTLLIVFVDHPGYSEFVFVAWILAVIFYILSYLALVMPDWLKKRIIEE